MIDVLLAQIKELELSIEADLEQRSKVWMFLLSFIMWKGWGCVRGVGSGKSEIAVFGMYFMLKRGNFS